MAINVQSREEAKEAAREMTARLLADSRAADHTMKLRSSGGHSAMEMVHLPPEAELQIIRIIEEHGFQKLFNTLYFAVVSRQYDLEYLAEKLAEFGEPESANLEEEAELWEKFRQVMVLLLVPRMNLTSPVDGQAEDIKSEACRIITGFTLDNMPEFDDDDLRAEIGND